MESLKSLRRKSVGELQGLHKGMLMENGRDQVLQKLRHWEWLMVLQNWMEKLRVTQ